MQHSKKGEFIFEQLKSFLGPMLSYLASYILNPPLGINCLYERYLS